MTKTLSLLMLIAMPATAQWRHFADYPTRATGYFGGGFSQPVNPAARNLDVGWNLAGGVGVTTKYVGVMLDAMFNDFGVNRSKLGRVSAFDGSQRYWAVTVDPVFNVNQSGPLYFYLMSVGGIYSNITYLDVLGCWIHSFLVGSLNISTKI